MSNDECRMTNCGAQNSQLKAGFAGRSINSQLFGQFFGAREATI